MKLLTSQQIQFRLDILYNGLVQIDASTYKNTSTKAKFIHSEFGEWTAKPNDVLNGHSHRMAGNKKRKETCLQKYGVSHVSKLDSTKEKKSETTVKNYGVRNPQQNSEIALRTAKSSNKSKVLHHWKTGEEIVCQGSYEIAAIQYFNNYKVEFEWQPKVFTLPDGRTYRPDVFLVLENKWIEIKGYFRKDAEEKWKWFQSVRLNSELLGKSKLVSLGIL